VSRARSRARAWRPKASSTRGSWWRYSVGTVNFAICVAGMIDGLLLG
jgi:hypothetical protein